MLGSVSFLSAEIIIHHFKTKLALLQRCVHCFGSSLASRLVSTGGFTGSLSKTFAHSYSVFVSNIDYKMGTRKKH